MSISFCESKIPVHHYLRLACVLAFVKSQESLDTTLDTLFTTSRAISNDGPFVLQLALFDQLAEVSTCLIITGCELEDDESLHKRFCGNQCLIVLDRVRLARVCDQSRLGPFSCVPARVNS